MTVTHSFQGEAFWDEPLEMKAMRRSVFAMAAALAVTLGLFAGSSAEAAPVTAGGALGAATADLNRVEPVQYVGGRCWRNAGWHGAGWYPCGPGVVYRGGGNWHWRNHYSWHNNYHNSWHNHSSWHRNSVRRSHAHVHRGGGHRSVHHGGHRHGGGHHGGGHHGGHHR